MSTDKIDRLLDALRKKLESPAVRDDATGKVEFNLATGGLSGPVKIKVNL